MSNVTLKDIARMVGVSINTASRALKDKPDIGQDTRRRVKDAAALLGYRPNMSARSLVLKKTSTIGVAVTEIDNPVRMEFCEQLRRHAANDGYRLIITAVQADWPESGVADVEELLSRGVDGLIAGFVEGLVSEMPLGGILSGCRRGGIPALLFGMPETAMADCVEIDFKDSAYRLTDFVIGKGRRPVAFFGGSPDEARVQGYFKAMEEHGLGSCASLWPVERHRLDCARAAMEGYLDANGRPPEAIVAANDLVAIGAMSVLKARGFNVPGDTAVVGFDNTEIGAYFDPLLTSIGFSSALFAQSVWGMLKSRLDGSATGPARKLRLSQELIERGSC